jgi:hypothetical protein
MHHSEERHFQRKAPFATASAARKRPSDGTTSKATNVAAAVRLPTRKKQRLRPVAIALSSKHHDNAAVGADLGGGSGGSGGAGDVARASDDERPLLRASESAADDAAGRNATAFNMTPEGHPMDDDVLAGVYGFVQWRVL